MLDRPPRPTLRQDRLSCTLCPSAGGSLGRLVLETDDGPRDLVRPVTDDSLTGGSALDLAGFPLVPFSNRVAGGCFCFDGRAVRLDPRPAFGPHALHGDGWMVPWDVAESDDRGARLTFRRAAGDWPWSYRAEQSFQIRPDGLDLTLSLTNRSDAPMPGGIGWHPYFAAPEGTILQSGFGGVWTNGADYLPDRHVPLPDAWNFETGVTVEDIVVDNCFTGWNGTARVIWPEWGYALRIDADPVFGHAVVYAPEGEPFVCVEPVSHRTDALNRPDEPDAGLRVLAPGETLSGTLRLTVETLA